MAKTNATAALAAVNAARDASPELTAAIPRVTLENWGDAYNLIFGRTALANMFRYNLDNYLAQGAVEHFTAENDWKEFKESHPYGAGVKETYIGMVDVFPYELTNIERNELKREITEAWEAVYLINLKRYYKQTLGDVQFRELAATLDGVYSYMDAFVQAQYESVNWDDKVLAITLIQDAILKGKFAIVPVDMSDPKNLVKTLQEYAFNMTEPRRQFNSAGVPYSTPANRQIVILSSAMQAALTVDVVSAAYNEWAVKYGDRIKVVSTLSKPYDIERLQKLQAINPDIPVITSEQSALLDGVQAVIIDERALRIFDNLFEMWDEGKLNSTMERQYFLHVWQTYAISPWGNGIVFVSDTTNIEDPETVTATVVAKTAQKGNNVSITLDFAENTGSLTRKPYTVGTDATATADMLVGHDGTIIFASGSAGAVLTAQIGQTVYATADAVTPEANVGDTITFTKQ